MSSVDNRVVRMTFDNAQFEKKIKSTMEMLAQFEKSLKMDGATAGFDEISKAAEKLNISTIGDKASDEADRVAKASSDASSSIEKIDDAADNADFSAVSNAANDAAADVNRAAESTDFSPMSSGAQDAAMDINNAAATVDMSPVVQEANEAAESFNALEMVAAGVLLGLGEKILGLATGGLSQIGGKIKEYTLDPMVQGFQEYQTQIGSIQTIMANTGMDFSADEDIAKVNATLDELNTYADKTIYNFTEMTRNIGTFTAAGVDLDTSATAIKGIANLAALSGSNSQQASTAMYQLSQALSTGTLKLQDWNSVVNAGMGGQVFQDALKETARAHGIAVDEIIEANGSFRESLQEGWVSSEILTETLNHMAISYNQVGDDAYNAAMKELLASGYNEEQATSILKLAKTAEESATKVRTWNQLWDTVKESIGSQWSAIWRNFIGDFKQATDTFTFLSNTISDGIESMFGGLVHVTSVFSSDYETGTGEIINVSKKFWGENLRVWNEKNQAWEEVIDDTTGHFARVKGTMDYLVEAITKPLGAIKDAFDTIFATDDNSILYNLDTFVGALTMFAKQIIISDDAATALREIFEGIFATIDFGIRLVLDLIGIVSGLFLDLYVDILKPLGDVILTIFAQVGKLLVWIHDKFIEVEQGIAWALEAMSLGSGEAAETLDAVVGKLNIPDKIQEVGDKLLDLLEVIWDFMDIPNLIAETGEYLGSIISTIVNGLADIFGWTDAVEEANWLTEATGHHVAAIDVFMENLTKNPIVAFFKDLFDILSYGVDTIMSYISGMTEARDAEDQNAGKITLLAHVFGIIQDAISVVLSAIKVFVDILNAILAPILQVIIGIIRTFVTLLLGGLPGAINFVVTAFKVFSNILSVIFNVLSSVLPVIGTVIIGIVELATAIGGFIGRMVSFIASWEPIAYVIDLIKRFKEGVVDYILGVPDKLAGAFGGMSDGASEGASGIQIFLDKIRELYDYFTTVTPEQFIEDVKNFFKGIRDNIVNYVMDIPNKIKGVYDSLMNLDFEEVANNFIAGLNNFKSKIMGNGVITNKAVLAVGDILRFFGVDENTSRDVIETLYNYTLGPLSKFISDISTIIRLARDNSSDIPSFISNLLSLIGRYILNGLVGIYNTVAGKVEEIFNYISNINYKDVANAVENVFISIYESIVNILSNFGPLLHDLLAHLIGEDNANAIMGFIENNIATPFLNGIESILQGLEWAKQNSEDLPGFIANVAKLAWGAIKDGFWTVIGFIGNMLKSVGMIFVGGIALVGKLIVDSIKALVNGDSKEEIKESWKTIGSTINNSIRGVLDNISPKLREIYDKVVEFFFGTEERAGKFSEIIGNVKETVGNTFGSISRTIGKVKDKIAAGFEDMLNRLSEVNGPIGDAFSFIKDKLEDLKEKMSNLKMPKSFGEFVEKIRDLFGMLKDALTTLVFGSEETENVSIFDRLKEIFGDAALDILSKLKDLPAALADLLNGIVEKISLETIQKVSDLIRLILAVRLFYSLEELVNGVGRLAKAFARKINKEQQTDMQSKLRSIAITFAIMAGALFVISMIKNPWEAIGVLIALGAVVAAMMFVSGKLGEWTDGYKSGEELLKAALSIAAVALGILLMLHTIEKLTQFDYAANTKGLIALGAFLVVFIGVYALFAVIEKFVGDGGKNAIQVAIGIGILAIALRLMLGPVERISEYVKDLDETQLRNVIDGLLGLGAFIAILALALQLVPDKGAIGAAVSMVIMAAAVAIIVDALALLAPLAMINPWALVPIVGAIGALMGEFALIAYKVKSSDLILASLAIAIFSAGISVMIEALAKLAPLVALNPWGLVPAMVGMAVLIGEFGIIAKKCEPKELLAASVAIVIFSGAIYVISAALSKLAELPVPNIVAAGVAIGAIVLIFGVLVGVLSQPAISVGATTVLPLLALAFIALGAACLMIAKALQWTVEGLIQLSMATPILMMFVSTVASNFLAFAAAAIALAAIGAAFLIFGPGAILAGAGLMLLSAGIRDFLVLIAELPMLLENASASIQTLLGMLPDFIANLWTTVTTWFNETLLPNLGGFFEGIFGKLGELKDRFLTWWNETGWPMLQETGGKFWEWAQTEGIPKLGEFILGIFGKLGELKDKFFAWMESDGWPMLQEAGGKFWEWVQNEGIPKLGEFIGKVMGKLGDLIAKVWEWVKTKGLPAAANWVKEMVEKAKNTFGPKIEAFIKDIPNKIATALRNIWNSIVNKGKEIASGLAEGMNGTEASNIISNAVSIVSSWIPDGVKEFFNIQSPSKLMRDEVGRYIPEGLAAGITKYASVAGAAATDMARETMAGVRNGLDDTAYLSPTITPVIDINDFSNDMDSYNRLLNDSLFGGNANYSSSLSGEVSLSSQLASLIDDDMSRTDTLNRTMYDIQQALQENTDRTEELYSYTTTILDALNGNTSAIRDSVANGMNIYMDSGAMVGALAPEMDRALGRRASLAERGVY